ncbi:hypothetical protein EDB81DRAFT_691883 [Dactylonectria macrodidyma]|uniref:DUF6546 domain-containing protein n=1 Tax=Dactylonectria macrodidyma TaxID=307937 RepID=A0A9P9EMN5_9HYPO|nr:hypothetical protein EDB81DRAFT_691883 [Dactylonectria macrodidyma]
MNLEAIHLAARTGLPGTNGPISKYSWFALPLEIRLIILGLVAAVEVEEVPGRQKSSIPIFASVCLEWQLFFERHTFRRLVLDSSTLTKFAKFVKGNKATRLNYIRFVWLRIKLPEYTCLSCSKAEDGDTVRNNNRIFTSAIMKLMKVLSAWKPGYRREGLTLEISAHSPSDGKHQFMNIEMEDDYPFQLEEDLKRTPGVLEYHRRRTEEIRQRQGPHRQTAVTRGHLDRAHGTPFELRPWRLRNKRGRPMAMPTLAEAPIVTGLRIRGQGFRSLAAMTFARLFQESLTGLLWFGIQRWTSLRDEYEEIFFRGMKLWRNITDSCVDFENDVLPALPRSLMTFSFDQWQEVGAPPRRARLARLMATWCQHLTAFCPPRSMDALDFFRQIIAMRTQLHPGPVWSKLELLCLNCRSFEPSSSQATITEVLVFAGKAAKLMPNLREMEIWNTSPEYCYLFRYKLDRLRATIIWRCPEETNFDLTPGTIETWVAVASERTHRQLSVEVQPFLMAAPALPIYQILVLRRSFFDPVTLAQSYARMTLRQNR